MIANLFISDACVRRSSTNKTRRSLAPGRPPDCCFGSNASQRETEPLLGLFRGRFVGSWSALGPGPASHYRPIDVLSVTKGQCPQNCCQVSQWDRFAVISVTDGRVPVCQKQ